MNVSVTNKNEDEYARRFDGKLYEFPPGIPVVIPDAAATYLFAYGQGDAERTKILIRNGWQKNGLPGMADGGPKAAMARLHNFVFKSAPDDEAPAKPKKSIAPGTAAAVAAKEAAKRVPGGIGAMSSMADEHGQNTTSPPRGTIGLPGRKGPLVPASAA